MPRLIQHPRSADTARAGHRAPVSQVRAVVRRAQDFWQALATEEHSHAKKLRRCKRSRPGTWLSRVERLKPRRSDRHRLRGDQATRAGAGGLTSLQALPWPTISRTRSSTGSSFCHPRGLWRYRPGLEELRAETEEHRRVLRKRSRPRSRHEGRASGLPGPRYLRTCPTDLPFTNGKDRPPSWAREPSPPSTW